MLEAIKSSEVNQKEKKSLADNEYYQKSKKRYNDLRRSRYKEMKNKNDKRRR
jgi:hypothetical protein